MYRCCANQKLSFYFSGFDDRYGYPGTFSFLICDECGHIQLDKKFNEAELKNLYSNYYPRSSFNVDDYRPLSFRRGIRGWLEGESSAAAYWVKPNSNVLEIGSGWCETIGYLNTIGCSAYGTELDTNAKIVAEKYNFNLKVGLFNKEDYLDEFFDFILLNQVLEHLSDPHLMVKDLESKLKVGGKIIISIPNCNSFLSRLFRKKWINWHVPFHLNFFTKKSLKYLSKECNLEIETIKSITHSNWMFYQAIHALTLPNIGGPSPFWSTGSKSMFQKISCYAVEKICHYSKINQIISRIFDLMRFGDNYLIIMVKK